MKVKLVFIVLFISRLSFSQTDFQSVLMKEKNFCGYFDYYVNTFIEYDFNLVVRMTVDSLIRDHKVEKIQLNQKGLFKKNFPIEIYDSIGNNVYEMYNPNKNECLKKEYDTSGRLIDVEKKSFTGWCKIERYQYDHYGNLIEILIEKRPLPPESGDFQGGSMFCLSFPKKWSGEYDHYGNLIQSEILWDTGKIYRYEYQYLSGKLKFVTYDSKEGTKIKKEFCYKGGLLESIHYYTERNREISVDYFEWEIINKN